MSPSELDAMRHEIKRESVSKRLRFEILKRDSFCCQYCGRRSAPGIQLHVDHVIPVCKGGATIYLNLVTACGDCNAGKSGNPISDDDVYLFFARGILCKRLRIERDKDALRMMTEAHDLGADVGILIWLCRTATSWQQFKASIDDFVSDGVPIFDETEEAA
jgi:hypothetical protein